jgi:hypothetical protein
MARSSKLSVKGETTNHQQNQFKIAGLNIDPAFPGPAPMTGREQMELRQERELRERQQRDLEREFREYLDPTYPPPVDVDVPWHTVPRLGLLGNVPAPEPEPTPLERVLGLPGQVPAKRSVTPSPLRQVLGLDPIFSYGSDPERRPDLARGALRKVLGLDPI